MSNVFDISSNHVAGPWYSGKHPICYIEKPTREAMRRKKLKTMLVRMGKLMSPLGGKWLISYLLFQSIMSLWTAPLFCFRSDVRYWNSNDCKTSTRKCCQRFLFLNSFWCLQTTLQLCPCIPHMIFVNGKANYSPKGSRSFVFVFVHCFLSHNSVCSFLNSFLWAQCFKVREQFVHQPKVCNLGGGFLKEMHFN